MAYVPDLAMSFLHKFLPPPLYFIFLRAVQNYSGLLVTCRTDYIYFFSFNLGLDDIGLSQGINE